MPLCRSHSSNHREACEFTRLIASATHNQNKVFYMARSANSGPGARGTPHLVDHQLINIRRSVFRSFVSE